MAEPLYGTYYPSIDNKGRMAFPSKLRDILGPEFYLVPGKGGKYISVYSPEEYAKFEATLKGIPGVKGDQARRFYIPATDKQVPDRQGRIFIKDNLMAYAGITDEVVVIGASRDIQQDKKHRHRNGDGPERRSDFPTHMAIQG